jgi:MFS family permease
MTALERKITFILASIYAFRMLGLFMILPIFSLYIPHLRQATPFLIGFALGIYGCTQAFLQIPLGMLSDRIGRKPVIVFGLILFMFGSIIAAMSHNIYGIIIGRALQGAGAVGSTLMALLADHTADEHRLKAMSLMGMVIGFSFMIAMVLGPLLNTWVGLAGIFWFTAFLAVLAIFILLSGVPTAQQHLLHRDSEAVLTQFKKILTLPELLRLDFGIFSLHAMLMALFIMIPFLLTDTLHMNLQQQWLFYLPVLLGACFLMFPCVIISEAKRLLKPFFISAIFLLMLTQLLLIHFHNSLLSVGLILCLFFTAFTFLEASLPSLISKLAPVGAKGTAMGIYSSSQFLGIFFGATLGGYLFNHWGAYGVISLSLGLSLVWLALASLMKPVRYWSSKIISLNFEKNAGDHAHLTHALLQVPGIKEALLCPDEGLAYLKIDKREFSEEALTGLLTKKL